VYKIDPEEQSRNNSFAHGTVAEGQNGAWNALICLISSKLCIKTGTSGERNRKRSQIGGFKMYFFMGGENTQINSCAGNSTLLRGITLKLRRGLLGGWWNVESGTCTRIP